jgi:hypothetical protein
MNIDQVREQLHRLIDDVDDLYVLNGMYRTLMADKRQREEYEAAQKQPEKPRVTPKKPGGRG